MPISLRWTGRADAGQQQDVGRADGAGGQDNLLALDGEGLAAALHLDAHGLLALEDDAAGDAVGPDGQVQAVSGRVEIAQGGAPADAIGVVEGYRADAAGLGVVVVGDFGEPLVAAGLEEGGLVGQQFLALEASGDDGAVGVVEVIAGEVGVGLDAPQEGQQLDEAPLVVAHLGPGVVVLRYSAQEHLAVDGAGAAGDLAAGHHHGWGGVGGLAPELPVVVAGHDVGGGGVAELDLVGKLLEIRVVAAGLQQQHRYGGVFAQAGCHDGAGGPGADHDVVVLHGCSPCAHGVGLRAMIRRGLWGVNQGYFDSSPSLRGKVRACPGLAEGVGASGVKTGPRWSRVRLRGRRG